MPVCIVGMHRAGTSLVAKALHECGVCLGDEPVLSRPATDNLAGFWENPSFVALNDALLAAWGGDWDWPRPMPGGWENGTSFARFAARAEALLAEHAGHEPWGWKDPRGSLTLPFWTAIVSPLPVVVCVRHPLEVAASLRLRNGLSYSFGLGLWQAYYEAILAATQPESRQLVHYAALDADFVPQLQRLLDRLALPATDDQTRRARTAHRSDLRHSRFSSADLDRFGVGSELRGLYERLCSEAAWQDKAVLTSGRADAEVPGAGAAIGADGRWPVVQADRVTLEAAARHREEAAARHREVEARAREAETRRRQAEASGVAEALAHEVHRLAEEGSKLRSEIGALQGALRERDAALIDSGAALEDARAKAFLAGEAIERSRREVDDWKAAHDHAREALEWYREEIRRWQSSRLWRVGRIYWRLVAALRRWRLRLAPWTSRSSAAPASDRMAASTAEAASQSFRPAEAPRLRGVPAAPRGKYDVLVLSIVDWDFRFQRPQQLAMQFAEQGHRVFYLATARFLPPGGPAWETAAKGRNLAELALRCPRDLDIYGRLPTANDLEALTDSLAAFARDAGVGDAICKVDNPSWAPLALRLRERFGWPIVYDCMDEWTSFPGFSRAVTNGEAAFVRAADVTLVASGRLHEKWQGIAPSLHLVRNGVDGAHYERHCRANSLLQGLPRPILGYYGALASWVDVDLLGEIARRFPRASLVLAGGHFDVDLSPLRALPNVHLLGQRPYEDMPRLLWHFDVCLIPFLVNAITEATNPVKLYEYLSQGKPVVAPRLAELLLFGEQCYLATGQAEFLAQIGAALAEPADDPRRERRRELAAQSDWRLRWRDADAAVRAVAPRISTVIVTHDGRDWTQACLNSLLEGETWPNLEVIVVDNGSSDGTGALLHEVAARDPRVAVVRNPDNRGFAAANNQGIALSTGDVVVLLNNDTVVPPGLLGRLARHLRHDPSLGLVCPTTNFCGNEAKVDPDYTDLADLPRYAARRAAAHDGRVFDLAVAAMYCVAFRREVFARIGPLDESFGLGLFEDDDYSLRVRNAGLRVVCAEDAYVHHVGQGSFARLPRPEYDRLWRANLAYFEEKWHRTWRPHRIRDGVAGVVSKVPAR